MTFEEWWKDNAPTPTTFDEELRFMLAWITAQQAERERKQTTQRDLLHRCLTVLEEVRLVEHSDWTLAEDIQNELDT